MAQWPDLTNLNTSQVSYIDVPRTRHEHPGYKGKQCELREQ